jgi:hypothetical protein
MRVLPAFSAAPPPPAPPPPTPAAAVKVYLNIYDISPINNYLYWFGLGIFHSGVEGTFLRYLPTRLLLVLSLMLTSTTMCTYHGRKEYANSS